MKLKMGHPTDKLRKGRSRHVVKHCGYIAKKFLAHVEAHARSHVALDWL